MVLELVLVAVVLALVGLALYQTVQHHGPTASVQSPATPAPSSALGIAGAAAAVSEQDSSADSSLSADASTSANELTAADTDVANLGGSFDANSF